MVYLAAAQFVALAGLVWLLHKTHRQQVEDARVITEQHTVERADHLARLDSLVAVLADRGNQPHPDLRELVGIVDRLCQRVQAPDAAVTEHAMAQPLPPMPQPPLPDDDLGFWRAQGFEVAPTKEELAEALDG